MIDADQPPADGQYYSTKQPDTTWRQHLVMLLHLGAEIEHSLMVQYLYAAYSLGGSQGPPQQRATVEKWRNALLAVAREEMGHLLSVQNLLIFLGAPANLTRENFPWDRFVYPFPFALEPFSKLLLSKFIFAEMPTPDKTHANPKRKPLTSQQEEWEKRDELVRQRVMRILESSAELKKAKKKARRVGELYAEIISIISDKKKIADAVFNESSYAFQASWDDWARAYKPKPKPRDEKGADEQAKAKAEEDARRADADAHVIVAQVATRQEAISALRAIAGQGEGPYATENIDQGLSHYQRFLRVFEEVEAFEKVGDVASLTRDVPTNPTTRREFAEIGNENNNPIVARRDADLRSSFVKQSLFYRAIEWIIKMLGQGIVARQIRSYAKEPKEYWTQRIIDAPVASALAHLFNARYTLLLFYISFTYQLSREEVPGRPSLRALAMHRAFGEMYHLKTIAGMLVRLPRRDAFESGVAAPPFEMPYTVQLPLSNRDSWIKLRDLLTGSEKICEYLLKAYEPGAADNAMAEQLELVGGRVYLRTLMQLDLEAVRWADGIIAQSN